MARTRIKESVTPSGVPFTVRSLKGKDQETLTEVNQGTGQGDTANIDKMMADCLLSIGDKSAVEITEKFVCSMLSNDRKFILVTIRQHTLNYKKVFDFKYEWPLQTSKRDKDVQKYSVNFNAENFPVEPYWWLRDKMTEELEDNADYIVADGHDVLFPNMYDSYKTMMEAQREIEGAFEDGTKYKWKMLSGDNEKNIASLKKININTSISQRGVKYLYGEADSPEQTNKKELVWTIFNTSDADVMDLEYLRGEITDKEGTVDTSLTIQNQNDANKEVQVDLITIPAFFFPSMGQ